MAVIYKTSHLLPKFTSSAKNKNFELTKIKKVLVLRLEHLGDVLLITPLLRTLRINLPNAHISIAVGSWAKVVLEGNSDIDEILIFDHPMYNREKIGRWEGVKGSIRFIRKIRKQGYDVVIDARSNLSTLIFTYLSGARYKVGFDIGGRGFLLSNKVKYNNDYHQIENNLSLARALDMDTLEQSMVFRVSENDRDYVKNFLRKNKIGKNDSVIAIHPGAPWPPRRWAVENIASLISQLVESYGYKILIVGDKEDAGLCEDLKKMVNAADSKNIVDCVGKMSLKQTASLLQNSRLFMGVDSAPMHIAAAMGTTVVALMGAGEYPRFAPYGKNNVVIRKNVSCSPCHQNYGSQICSNGENICMKSITVDEVKAVIVRLMESKRDVHGIYK